MQADVPPAFVRYLRRQRFVWIMFVLVVMGTVIALLSAFNILPHAAGGVGGGFGAASAPLVLLLASRRSPIRYEIRDGSIRFVAPKFLPGLIAVAYQHQLVWKRDALLAIELSHWEGLPALRLKTAHAQEGFLMPLERADMERVAAYLAPLVVAPSE